jgi:signal transduction histidine kinase
MADRDSLGNGYLVVATRHGVWAKLLIACIYAGCLAAFIADLMAADTLAFGVFYVPLVATAVFYRDRRAVWVLAGIATAMIIIGTFVPYIYPDIGDLILSRFLSICAVIATAFFIRHARSIWDQLAEQRRRAEAAEQSKNEMLTDLRQEIQGPLHSMIDAVQLIATRGRPDQAATLGSVRASGRRLARTIDDLVDLTQLEENSLPIQSIDLDGLLREAAEAARKEAALRQINLTMSVPSGGPTMVSVNPWAARRIMENQIADAIAYSRPGGWIEVSTATADGHASAVIAASGTWPSRPLRPTRYPDAGPLKPSEIGLVLQERLSRAIGARLLISEGPGEGTTVSLVLPCAPADAAG